jgi:hypothetical protein
MIAAFMALAALPGPFYAMMAKKGEEKRMEFHEFARREINAGEFIFTVEGEPRKSPFTGKKYAHYETVAFTAEGGEWRILEHTEGEITIRRGNDVVSIGYRSVRTRLTPSFERTYSASELRHARSETERALASVFEEDHIEALTLREYGLEAGKRYHGRIRTETYYLPPEPGGEPRKRENRVLVVSDRPLSENIELTPLYRGWSY